MKIHQKGLPAQQITKKKRLVNLKMLQQKLFIRERKKTEKSGESISELCDNFKWSNMHTGNPQR